MEQGNYSADRSETDAASVTSANGAPLALLPQHQALLTASAIASEVAEERGYWSAVRKTDLARLGFAPRQQLVPALVLPLRDMAGGSAGWQIRPDRPRHGDDGRPIKYESPPKQPQRLDVPPRCRPLLRDPKLPLVVTEGSRKADAAAAAGLCAVSIAGVWSWRGTNELGGKTALADWEAVALVGRRVLLAFDSDALTNPRVHQALSRLTAFLESRDSRVEILYLPPGAAGTKTGLDDYLAAGHTVADLLSLAEPGLRPPPAGERASAGSDYHSTPDGLFWAKRVGEGSVPVRLTNFQARIVAQTEEDDGAETRRLFEVEAQRGDRARRFSVAAAGFDTLSWVGEQLGASALVYPGQALRDHARAAIRLLSGEVPEQRIYTATGWREIAPGQWAYLHGNGAIGGAGVTVRLPASLAGYALPEPPTGETCRGAVRASLSLLDLADDALTVPLVAAVSRAALAPCDFSLHVAGPTGAFKTELAALAQQHYGAGMDARNLPAAWSSTDNALEAAAFSAACALLTIDDFAPTGPVSEVDRLHQKADRVLRGQGNRSGRARLRPDGTPRPTRTPRGLVLSTGEDVPRGQSLRARLLVLEVGPGAIDPERLAHCQRAAAAGQYAAAMAAFLAWLAPRYAAVRAGMRAAAERFRDAAAGAAQHRRTPSVVAELALGWQQFLAFAQAVGALSETEAAALWERGWNALGRAAAGQQQFQAAGDPAQRFCELLAGAIAAGRAHVASPTGDAPEHPASWGWRRAEARGTYEPVWQPQGTRIGWVDGADLYLNPDASLEVARRAGDATGDGIALTGRTLHRRLQQRGLLVTTDAGRDRLLIRRSLQGARHAVLHLHAAHIIHEPAAQPAQPAQPPGLAHAVGTTPPVVGPFTWAVCNGNGAQPAQEPAQEPAECVPAEADAGPVGPVGPVEHAYNGAGITPMRVIPAEPNPEIRL